eukprot:TRINITY_DN3014_c0_g1_i1.p1 TRINITY_DN3014_c0_g1~~TRINITY_DN3014_c0_g1_i1.p1  ORF type:complete len:763 (+),score=176.43 TRINITY_DN3014_c0_g1_i1:37-2325(+)
MLLGGGGGKPVGGRLHYYYYYHNNNINYCYLFSSSSSSRLLHQHRKLASALATTTPPSPFLWCAPPLQQQPQQQPQQPQQATREGLFSSNHQKRFGHYTSSHQLPITTTTTPTPTTTTTAMEGPPHTDDDETTQQQPQEKQAHQKTFEELTFDNKALRVLPVDPESQNYVRQVPDSIFSRVWPTPVLHPKTVVLSPSALALLDLFADPQKVPQYFSGNKLIPGVEPAAHCYCGYQFGYFSGQLGDGATMYLGEVINNNSERWELQFKGAGKTPYSRTADGRKVLRSSLREFLCSEAMHHLGVPTTRAGSVVTSSTFVDRDMFYNGNTKQERCTIITRIAQTFIRFGSFEIFKATDKQTGRKGPSAGNIELLITLLNYTIETFYPEIWNAHSSASDRYLAFYREVVLRTARLVAAWQCVGFCHGVLNTDNMSIVGLTLDYGPFGFMEHYDPQLICNTSDDGGRYTFEAQPEICRWNCIKLAEALSPVLPLSESKGELDKFQPEFERVYYEKMYQKFGFVEKMEGDRELITDFFIAMQTTGADFTNSFRCLSRIPIPQHNEGGTSGSGVENAEVDAVTEYLCDQGSNLAARKAKNEPKMPLATLKALISLAQTNPHMLPMFGVTNPQVLINELAKYEQQDKATATGPTNDVEKRQHDKQVWQEWMGKYLDRLQREYTQAPSSATQPSGEGRVAIMNKANPKFVLRNYIAQRAIQRAEEDNFSEAQRVYDLLVDPFTERNFVHGVNHYDTPPPSWASDLCVSCSS